MLDFFAHAHISEISLLMVYCTQHYHYFCRSSTSTAATAFAIATSASSNPPDRSFNRFNNNSNVSRREKCKRKESVMSTAATMRVLNVLRHWISKHAQDFELHGRLKALTIEFLEDISYSPNLLPAEHKAANQLLRLITKEETDCNKVDLKKLLTPPSVSKKFSTCWVMLISQLKINIPFQVPTKESIETLSALEIAEQMTYLDHQIFISIASEYVSGNNCILFGF